MSAPDEPSTLGEVFWNVKTLESAEVGSPLPKEANDGDVGELDSSVWSVSKLASVVVSGVAADAVSDGAGSEVAGALVSEAGAVVLPDD